MTILTPLEGIEQLRVTHTLLVKVNGMPCWKTLCPFLVKLNIHFPYVPATLLPGYLLRELKSYVHTKTCTQMLTAAVFIIAPNGKQPEFPPRGEWITSCDPTVQWKSCSAMRGVVTWMNLKGILLSRRRQVQKGMCCRIRFI